MATLLKVLNNLADIKSAGGVALRVRTQEGYGEEAPQENAAEDLVVRERATTASTFDPPEAVHGRPSEAGPPIALAALPSSSWSRSIS
jgi:hypothetical protein